VSDSDLNGVHEATELLGLTRQALADRRRGVDFPMPIAELACGPVWTRAQLVKYARSRVSRFQERPAIEALAREPVRFHEVLAAGRETR
jgi:hypothetical protein